MKTLEQKIEEIKILLSYIPNNEITIDTEETSNFFIDFFTGSKFHAPDFGMVTIGNYLKSIAENPTMFIKYEYDWTRDDCEIEFILFSDVNAKYKEGHGMYGSKNAINSHERGDLEYSDIPERIWDIIFAVVYKKAKECVNDDIILTKKSYERAIENFNEFNKLENLQNAKILF